MLMQSQTGYRRQLELNDIYGISPKRAVEPLTDKMRESFKRRVANGDKYPLLWAIHETFFFEFWLGGMCQLQGVRGAEGADPGDDRGPVPHLGDDGLEQGPLLGIGGRGRLPRRAVDDEGIVALHVNQVGSEPTGLLVVHRAVGVEGRDHGRLNAAERQVGHGDQPIGLR